MKVEKASEAPNESDRVLVEELDSQATLIPEAGTKSDLLDIKTRGRT